MTKCGNSYGEVRAVCINCEDYAKCDIELCEFMLLKATDEETIDYWKSRIAVNRGG